MNTKPTLTLNNLKDIPSSIAKRKLADYVEVTPKAPTDKAIALQIVNAVMDGDAKKYAALVNTIEGRNAMKYLNADIRERARELGATIRLVPPTTKPTTGSTILTPTALAYLRLALEKNSEALHPNFVRSIKSEDQLAFQKELRCTAARMVDQHGLDNPRLTAVKIGGQLKTDARAYVQFFKNLATDCAFAAHMDCVQYGRALDPNALAQDLGSMIEDENTEMHTITDDMPVFDQADIDRQAPQEEYAGGDDSLKAQPIATSEFDAYDAIERLQAWFGLSITSMKPEQREYWGVDGLFPLGQRREETIFGVDYKSIHNFDDYRTYTTQKFREKRRSVTLDPAAEELMLQA